MSAVVDPLRLLSTVTCSGILAGSVILKMPQIARIRQSKSVLGLSPSSLYAEVISGAAGAMVCSLRRYRFLAWGEGLFILVQNLALTLMLWRYSDPPMPPPAAAAAAVGFFAAAALMYLWLPPRFYDALMASNAPLLLCSTVPQILLNLRDGHTGQLSASTVGLKIAGAAARIFTTLVEIGPDPYILFNYALAVALNCVQLLQVFFFRDATATANAAAA
ncbi:unnamed protein product, partial [Phaeothamnion confervicola]